MTFQPSRTRTSRRLAILAACAAASCAAALAVAPEAGAVVVRKPDGHFAGIALKAGTPLTPAMQAQRFSPLAWRLASSSTSAGTTLSAASTSSSALPPGTYSSTFGGSVTDTTAYPPDGPAGNPDGCMPGAAQPGDPPYTYCVTDEQIQAELNSLIAHGAIPGPGPNPPGDATLYFINLPAGVDVCEGAGSESTSNPCGDTDFCAYHSSEGAATGPLYGVIPYADIRGCNTNQQYPNGATTHVDPTLSALSHEHTETITDPFGTGWLSAEQNEIGDLCAAPDVFGAPLSGSPPISSNVAYNQAIATGHYWVQDEYADSDGSNLAFNSCEQRPGGSADGIPIALGHTPDPGPLVWQGGPVIGAHQTVDIFWAPTGHPFPTGYPSDVDQLLKDVASTSQDSTRTGTALNVYDVAAQYGTLIQPTASFTAPASARPGQPVTFDASSSNDPQGNPTYAWDFGDGSTTSTTQPTVTHAYTMSGTHTVSLTVSDRFGGQSTPTSHDIHVLVPPVASFTLPTTPVHAGQPAVFNAGASGGPDGAITSYAWSFGDGAAGSGVTPGHVYAAAGFYVVTLTVTDSNASTASSSQSFMVGAPLASLKSSARILPTAQIARSGAAKAVLVHGRLVVLIGRVIRCPRGAGTCTTTVTLTTRTAGHRSLTIGTARIHTAAGHSSVISVKLNSRGQKLLRSRHRLTVTAKVSAAGSGLRTASSTLTFTIRLSRR